MKRPFFLVLLLLFCIISGCYVQNTSAEKHKTLVIASDYLEEGDSLFFSDFSAKEKIRIIIKPIDLKSLKKAINSNKYGHGIDLVMMRSLFSVDKLRESDFFHSIRQIKNDFKSLEPYISEKYKYVGIGIDPFVCVSDPDTNVNIRNYDDLKYHTFINLLEEEDLVPMFSTIMTKMNKVKTYDWSKAVFKNEVKLKDLNRYNSHSASIVLTTYEKFETIFKKDSILNRFTKLTFPNSSTSGTFYNLRTVCITAQAQDYTEALSFINYYLLPSNNERLNKHLHTISVSGEKDVTRLYYIDSKDIMQYYRLFNRILTKLD
jgi:hypothetical protein